MKIKPDHLKILRDAIAPLDTPEWRKVYCSGAIKANDINKRLLHASKLKIGDGAGMSGIPLYEYMHDSHIDTALKSIVPPL